MHRAAIALVTAAWAALAAAPVSAETPRAELGKRLRRFEIAWQEADPSGRARAVAPMSAAVRSFFSLDLSTAARGLDDAWFTVRGGMPPDDGERRAVATSVTATPILADTSAGTIQLALAPFYDAGREPLGGELRLTLIDAAGKLVVAEA